MAEKWKEAKDVAAAAATEERQAMRQAREVITRFDADGDMKLDCDEVKMLLVASGLEKPQISRIPERVMRAKR